MEGQTIVNKDTFHQNQGSQSLKLKCNTIANAIKEHRNKGSLGKVWGVTVVSK